MNERPHRWIGLVLAGYGILLNPFLIGLLFSSDGLIQNRFLFGGILGLSTAISLLGLWIHRANKVWFSNLGLSVLSVLLVLTASIAGDRVYGRFFKPETADLLFPANTKARHKTSEFDLTVQINNLGFRGPDASYAKTKKRVLVIGDSFTFGWGVEYDKSWVGLLAQQFPDIEFLNLGQGGNHPGDHVQIARKAIPLLKPDVVIVGVLQANDLHQLMQVIRYERGDSIPVVPKGGEESKPELVRRVMLNLFPNAMVRFKPTVDIRDRWLLDSKALIQSLNESQSANYQRMPVAIRSGHEKGLLNPSLIYDALHHPDYFREAVDTANPLCVSAVVRLHDYLVQLEEMTAANDAQLLVLSLPNRPYGLPETLKPLTELGFSVAGCDTLKPNAVFNMACEGLASPHLTFSFDEGAEPLYYTYDGHWTEAGNRTFATELIEQLDTLGEWKLLLTSSTF